MSVGVAATLKQQIKLKIKTLVYVEKKKKDSSKKTMCTL